MPRQKNIKKTLRPEPICETPTNGKIDLVNFNGFSYAP
jgi:hypothetical protein